jgi:hypothetical protein
MTEVGASSCLLLAETLQPMEQASDTQGAKCLWGLGDEVKWLEVTIKLSG